MESHKQDNTISANSSIVKFRPSFSLLAIAMAALIGWALSMIPSDVDLQMYTGALSGISAALYLLILCNVGGSRSATVIRSFSGFMLTLTCLVLVAMALWCETAKYFVITSAFLVIVYLAVVLGVAKSGQ